MRSKVLICSVMGAVIALAGCAAQRTVTNLPPGVTEAQAQSWDKAVSNLDKIANVTSSVRKTVIALNKQGIFPDSDAYATTLIVLGRIDQIQLSASALLKQTPNTFSDSTKQKIIDYVNQIAAQVSVLNTSGVIGIKNPSSQQEVTQLIAEITAAIDIVLAL